MAHGMADGRPVIPSFHSISHQPLAISRQPSHPYGILDPMSVPQSTVLEALKVVQDPDLHRDIVSLGFIKELTIDGGRVAFTIELTTPACPVKDQMGDQARAAVM